MNNEKDIIVGLDIGTTKIACFIGQRGNNDKVKIIGFGKTESIGVERGVVHNIVETAKSITKAVDMASEQAGITVEEVYVGIAGQHIKSMQNLGTIMIPPERSLITQEDIDRLIEEQHNILLNPGEDIIHIFPQSYIIDGEELDPEKEPVGVAGKQLKANFHIVTGNTINLVSIHDSVKMAGLRIKGVVLEPIASAHAVLDNLDKRAGVVLVDIGGGTTDIAIFNEGVIRHTSVLAIAGNAITNDIKQHCMILREQAETLKTRFGSCLPQNVNENDIISIPGLRNQQPREISMRSLAEIINTRTETILEQVDFEIKKARMEKQVFAGVVLTGGGAQLRHIKELTEYITGIDTRIGLPDEHLDKDTNPEIINTMYATGIGLVLHGFYELDEQRRHIAEEEPEPMAEEAVKEPDTIDIFGEMPQVDPKPHTPAEDPTGKVETDDEEEEKPQVKGKKPKEKSQKKKKGFFGMQFSKAIEKYFNDVFNDKTIRDEGEEDL